MGQAMGLGTCPYREWDRLWELEEGLHRYGRIFLVMDKGFARMLYEATVHRQAVGKKVLALVTDGDGFENHAFADFCKIGEEEAKKLCRLYYMYEFSDRFEVVARDSRFGTLFHYVDTGLLTAAEMADALLYGSMDRESIGGESMGRYGSITF